MQIAPYFVLMLNDTIALEHEKVSRHNMTCKSYRQAHHNSQVEFKVKVLGTPKPSLQWFKDDLEVFSSDRLEIREEEDGGTVIVREARLGISYLASNISWNITSSLYEFKFKRIA